MLIQVIKIAVVFVSLTIGAAMAQAPVRGDEGTIEAIEMYRASDDRPLNPGTLVGGIAGGLIGHQIGSGRGNTAATIAGAVGGAVVGNEIHKKQSQVTRYRIVVRLDSGGTRTIEDPRGGDLRVGDRVRVEGNQIHRI